MDVTGTSVVPTIDLPPGVVFWRATWRTGGVTGTTSTPTWQFYAGTRSAPVDTSWGTTLDLNGDGLPDVAIGSAGRAFIYLGEPSGLPAQETFHVAGIAVASAGDLDGDGYADLVTTTSNATSSTVNVNIYPGGPSPASTLSSAAATFPATSGSFVASAGDVNGDGYGDLLVGSAVHLGGPAGLSAGCSSSVQLTFPDTTATYPYSVAAGDVNGDGYGDVLAAVGLKAHLFLGGPSGLAASPSAVLSVSGAPPFETFGSSMACVDVNGDGYADVIVGSVAQGSPTVLMGDFGHAYVFMGGAAGPSTSPAVVIAAPTPGSGAESNFGESMSAAGDVDRDGYADVVIGAPLTDTIGRAFLYNGGASGLGMTGTVLYEAVNFGNVGVSLAAAGDINSDGYADVIVGAPGGDRAFIFPGGGLPVITIYPDPLYSGMDFGSSVF